MALKHLADMKRDEFKTFLNSFDTVLADCDGVLWLGNHIIPGSPEVINTLKKRGKNVFYITNNSTKTREEFVEKFQQLGFNATKRMIRTVLFRFKKKQEFNRKYQTTKNKRQDDNQLISVNRFDSLDHY